MRIRFKNRVWAGEIRNGVRSLKFHAYPTNNNGDILDDNFFGYPCPECGRSDTLITHEAGELDSPLDYSELCLNCLRLLNKRFPKGGSDDQ